MRNGISCGRLLFFPLVLVILIPVVFIGYYYMVSKKSGSETVKALLDQVNRDFHRGLLHDQVDREFTLIRNSSKDDGITPERGRRGGDPRTDVLRRIRNTTFGEQGRMFVLSREGILLSDSLMGAATGENVFSIADSAGRKVFAEVMRAAEADTAGGYVEYAWPLPGGKGQMLKMAHVRSFPEWGLIIGASDNDHERDRIFDAWENANRRARDGHGRIVVLALLSALSLSLLFSYLFSRLCRREVDTFTRAFETAALTRGNIDSSRLKLGEFIRLSDSVNLILRAREKAENAERAGEQFYRAIVDDFPGMLCRFNPEGVLSFVNAEYCRYFNRTREELIGSSFFNLIPEEARERVRRGFRSLTLERPAVTCERPVFSPGGETRWQRWTDRAIFVKGELWEYQSFGEDITESRNASEALRVSEEKFSRIFRSSPNIMILLDHETRHILEVNETFTSVIGFLPSEALGKLPDELKLWENPEDRDKANAILQEKGRVSNLEVSYCCKSGEIRYGLFSMELIELPKRPVLITVLSDITTQKEAETALRASEGKYRALIENMDNGFANHRLVLDENGNPADFAYTEVNAAFERFCGVKREDIIGRSEKEINPSGYEAEFKWLETYSRVARTGKPERFEEFSELYGKWFAVSVYRHTPGCFVTNFSDITPRIQAEKALRESEEKHRILLDESSDPIFSFSAGGRYTYVNRAFADGVGKKVEEIIGNNIADVFSKEEAEKRAVPLDMVFSTGVEKIIEVRVPRPDGDRFYITTLTPIKDSLGKVMTVICSSKDITSRILVEEALLEEKERLAVTLRSIGDGVITTDRQGGVLLINRVAEELTGWSQSEAEGRNLEEVFPLVNEFTRDRCESPVERVLAAGGIMEINKHTLLIARDGREIFIADSGAPLLDRNSRIIGVVLVFRDITTQKRLEDELLRMEKLESVGVLAGGIAHDFNNILTGLLGAISLARLYTGPDHAAHDALGEAESQALRARDLTGQLLTFSKGGAPVRVNASIVETVRETVNFILRGSRVRAEFSFPEDLWTALVDLNQLSHVVNNLTLNAVQAMPDGGGIEVRAQNTLIGPDTDLPLSPGQYIHISFSDDGAGIPREFISRIFDPYFTTKQIGSGLGLATSWSILKRHNGHLWAESEPGAGAVFHLYLPAVGTAPVSAAEEKAGLHRGRGRVLIMDDDAGVRRTLSMLLEAMGYSCAAVDDGAAALEVYRIAREEGEPFDAVIMDLTVPGGVGGMEAMKGLLAFDPSVRAIVSSGYSTDPIMAEYSLHGFAGVLVKPYRVEDISRELRKVMERG